MYAAVCVSVIALHSAAGAIVCYCDLYTDKITEQVTIYVR